MSFFPFLARQICKFGWALYLKTKVSLVPAGQTSFPPSLSLLVAPVSQRLPLWFASPATGFPTLHPWVSPLVGHLVPGWSLTRDWFSMITSLNLSYI